MKSLPISCAMLRLLLSLLALVSGLTAVGHGHAARAYETPSQVASQWIGGGVARVSAHVVAHAREVARPANKLVAAALAPMRDVAQPATVRLRVDRARE